MSKPNNLPDNINNIILQALSSNASESIYFKDLESKFLFVSKYHLDYFGLSSQEECIGKTDYDYFTKEHALNAYNDEQEIIRTGQPIIGKVEQETWEGDFVSYVITSKYPLYDEDNTIIGTWGHSVNVAMTNNNGDIKTPKAKKEELNIDVTDDSRIDSLTSLKNSKAFYENMNLLYQDAMNSMSLPDKEHILLLIDMNDFQSVNSAYGHKYGDKALIFASQLISSIEDHDIHLYRYSGDKFAMLIEHATYDKATAIGESILELFNNNHFESDTDTINLNASIGMSRFKESLPFGNIHDIINLTDKRLYAAKKMSKPCLIHDNSYRL